MVKVKTSIYIDRDLWDRLKIHAARRGVEVGSLLEEMIREELVDVTLDKALLEAAGQEDRVLDFDPVEAKGPVSGLVRASRYERADNISGQ